MKNCYLSVLFILGLVLVLSSCSDDPPASATAPSSSPIDAYFAKDDAVEAAELAWQWRVQELVEVCMRGQGFTYKAEVFEPAETPGETDAERAQQSGYGLADAFLHLVRTQMADPTVKTLLSLNERETIEYYTALNGEAMATGSPQADPSDLGCVGQAIEDTGGRALTEGLSEFRSEYQQEAARIQASELAAASDQWVKCMRQVGFDYVYSPGDPELFVSRQIAPIQNSVQSSVAALSADQATALIEA